MDIGAGISVVRGIAIPLTRRCRGEPVNQGALDHHVGILIQGKARFLQFLERRLGNRADAEDVLQAAFLKLVAHEDSLRDEDKLVPWFYQLLRNLIIDHYRHRSALTRMSESAARAMEARTSDVDGELFRAVCTCVRDVLAALKPEQVEVIRRVEFDEQPLAEVARNLGITPNNASVRLHRARRALREALQSTCGVCAEHGCLDCSCRHTARP